MYRPVMRLGLIGFQDDAPLRELLETRNGVCRWEAGPVLSVDALWLNGAHAQRVKGCLVRVPSGVPTRPATLLNLQEVDRPIALTLPLVDPAIDPPAAFDPTSPASVQQVFTRFEAALLPLAAELALADALAGRRTQLASPVYQLVQRGRMVAVVDFDGEVGVLPGTSPAQIASADWCGRPAGAHHIPAHFARASVAEIMWQYASRTDADLLPERYRVLPIHFHGRPRVAHRLLRDAHMVLLAHLNAAPQTFVQLQAASGLAPGTVAKALACLYFAGSITTHRQNTTGRTAGATAVAAPLAPAGPPSSLLDDDDGDMPLWRLLGNTVPGGLEHFSHRR